MNDKIGRFGILTCNLTDPLSILIDKISISYNNKYNSVGFYYINDDGDYNITLFDLYDCYHIKWTVSHCIMSYFISSLYVIKIEFYSFDDENPKKFTSIYNTDLLKHNKLHIRSKLEEKFINIISGLLLSYNYERNYHSCLMNIINNKKSGDELISKVLLLLLDNYNIDIHYTDTFKKAFSLDIKRSINYINVIDNNFENIISNEILKLKECFLKIYTNHKILLDASIFKEKVVEDRFNQINDDDFLTKVINIKNLGYWINQIIISNNKIEQSCAVKNMITIYNNLINKSNIEYINLDNDINIMLNPDLIPDKCSSEKIIAIVQSNINTQNETDLNILSSTQLFDVLIYIDSLRDSSGFSDNRFSGVQNLITRELNYRTKLNNLS